MSELVQELYRRIGGALATDLAGLGFKPRGQEEWVHSRKGLQQRLATSLREPPGEDAGYLEVFPGFNFPEVEDLAASLQGKKPRPGFITCSLNIGLLTPKGVNLEWPLRPDGDDELIVQLVAQTVAETAPPFWDEFSSVADLLAHFDANDFRVCRGAEWPWRQIAACCLVGQTTRAVELLNARLAAAPPSGKGMIESAVKKMSQYTKV
jgi:hypothetical protein